MHKPLLRVGFCSSSLALSDCVSTHPFQPVDYTRKLWGCVCKLSNFTLCAAAYIIATPSIPVRRDLSGGTRSRRRLFWSAMRAACTRKAAPTPHIHNHHSTQTRDIPVAGGICVSSNDARNRSNASKKTQTSVRAAPLQSLLRCNVHLEPHWTHGMRLRIEAPHPRTRLYDQLQRLPLYRYAGIEILSACWPFGQDGGPNDRRHMPVALRHHM